MINHKRLLCENQVVKYIIPYRLKGESYSFHLTTEYVYRKLKGDLFQKKKKLKGDLDHFHWQKITEKAKRMRNSKNE